MKKGFTLIEVLISLVILSIIAIVSTNFLLSSIDLRNQSKSKVDDIKVFNLGVSTIRRDLMSTVNLQMRDNFGNQLPNFIGSNTDKKITFLGFINRIDSSRSSISTSIAKFCVILTRTPHSVRPTCNPCWNLLGTIQI